MNKLTKIFEKQLVLIGFYLFKKNFYFDRNGLVIVCNLQKSNYDNSHYINIGIWIEAIEGKNKTPYENICHIRFRADKFIDCNFPESNFTELLSVNNKDDEEKLLSAISKYFCPLIQQFQSIKFLTELCHQEVISDMFIDKKAKEFLLKQKIGEQ